jgi:hypothetical protein
MRNLSLSQSTLACLPDLGAHSKISAIAFDLDYDTIYVASERRSIDAGVEVGIYKIGTTNEADGASKVSVDLHLL